MKTSNARALQKFTTGISKKIDEPSLDNLLLKILEGGRLTSKNLKCLNDGERKKMSEILTGGLLMLKEEDRDTYLEKIEDVLSEESRRELWERNHNVILTCIDYLIREKNRMPTPTEISAASGLSRQTVYNHLKTYSGSEEQKEKQQTIAVLREKMMAKVYSMGMDGDTRAAKIFLDSTDVKEPSGSTKNQQNNFIQINGLTITQSQLTQLPEDKQKKLHELLRLVK